MDEDLGRQDTQQCQSAGAVISGLPLSTDLPGRLASNSHCLQAGHTATAQRVGGTENKTALMEFTVQMEEDNGKQT